MTSRRTSQAEDFTGPPVGPSDVIQLVHQDRRERAWPCARSVNSDGRPSVDGLDLMNHIDRRKGVPC